MDERDIIYWRRKFVEALRSTDVQQCFGAEQDGDKRCAVGLLMHNVLDEMKDFLDKNEVLGGATGYKQIVYYNDGAGMTFPEIADALSHDWGLTANAPTTNIEA
jgi:hypothetical protein